MTKAPNQMKPPRAQRPETPSLRPSSDRARQTKKNALDGQRAPAPDGARINRRAADRLRSGHLWVYASDVEAIETGQGDPPALLPVADNRGLLLGTALYSPASQIALRMISREAIGEAEWLELFEKRLRDAIDG